MAIQLARRSVTFRNSRNVAITLEAVYQDSLPSGSSTGTVVALHGVPGSHLDFKYIHQLLEKKNIRLIGVNFPGFGVTESHPSLSFDNHERNEFVGALMDELGLHSKVIMMGHSRGCENALMLAVNRKTTGLIMINAPGFRVHDGTKPFWFIQTLSKLATVPGSSFVVNPLAMKLYEMGNFKVDSGEIAMNGLRTLSNFAWSEQKNFANQLEFLKIKTALLYGGSDPLINKDISQEYAKFLAFPEMVSYEDNLDETQEAMRVLQEGGLSMCFEKEGHFLQKFKADFISECVINMLIDDKCKI